MSQQIDYKTVIASVVAGVVVIGGLVYGAFSNNTQLVTSIAMAGVGYLFGVVTGYVIGRNTAKNKSN
jgi:predicted GNAT superfamily acetyltransferase